MTRIVGVVLAAGAGTRMGGPKAELIVDGSRLVDRASAVLARAGCSHVLAVVRPGATAPHPIFNAERERGLRSSLTLAVTAAAELEADALAVVLVDTPGIGAEAVRTVLAGWRPGRAAVATYAGQRGHPIVMSPQLWTQALESAGPDEGARQWLTSSSLVDEIAVEADPRDLDTPAELAAWQRTAGQRTAWQRTAGQRTDGDH